MRDRCSNLKNKDYKRYGGRGITVYSEWKNSAASFLKYVEENLGKRPSGYSLGRINNDKGYKPGNIRWESATLQSRNRRSTRWITVGGETLCAKDWSKRIGSNEQLVSWRLNHGWTEKDAVRVLSSSARSPERDCRFRRSR
jgi:hypothetical protein